jgi:hypothetical protein
MMHVRARQQDEYMDMCPRIDVYGSV